MSVFKLLNKNDNESSAIKFVRKEIDRSFRHRRRMYFVYRSTHFTNGFLVPIGAVGVGLSAALTLFVDPKAIYGSIF